MMHFLKKIMILKLLICAQIIIAEPSKKKRSLLKAETQLNFTAIRENTTAFIAQNQQAQEIKDTVKFIKNKLPEIKSQKFDSDVIKEAALILSSNKFKIDAISKNNQGLHPVIAKSNAYAINYLYRINGELLLEIIMNNEKKQNLHR